MVRNVIGSLIALIGATAAVWSPFRPWYDGRHGSDFRIEDLFNNITDNAASVYGSVFLPLAVAGVLTLIGIVLRSRVLVAFAGVVVLGFTVLWMVRQGQSAGELTAGAHGLGVGVANALGGGALMVLGALVMSGRGGRVHGGRVGGRRAEERYDDGYGRYDEPAAAPPAAAPRPAPEPWDPGRPVTHDPATQEWTPEQYGNEGEPPDDGPATRPLTRPGFDPDRLGPEDGGRPPHQPSTEPWPRPTAPPPPPPPPTGPAHPQPPTPPVEWGKEHRQRGTQQPPEERE
ncbi:hypothetical protein [Streptomyces sp. NPDC053427]|uniref:hypothetical protein n=1 Tax=Streptomyces sp. NPDC053427 TaxID=3365701 RepID=UPI0037D8E5C9